MFYQLAIFILGITFIGILARAVHCENDLATDKYCQYFHSKLGATAGLILEGIVQPDKFVFTGGISNSVSVSQEIVMLDPVITVQYEEGKSDFYVSGFVVISTRAEEIKVKGINISVYIYTLYFNSFAVQFFRK